MVFRVPADGGSISSKGRDAQAGENVWQIDFTPFRTTGSYRLRIPALGAESYVFDIGDLVYAPLLRILLRGLYAQRCGTSHPAAYMGEAWADPRPCHPQDQRCRRNTRDQKKGKDYGAPYDRAARHAQAKHKAPQRDLARRGGGETAERRDARQAEPGAEHRLAAETVRHRSPGQLADRQAEKKSRHRELRRAHRRGEVRRHRRKDRLPRVGAERRKREEQAEEQREREACRGGNQARMRF